MKARLFGLSHNFRINRFVFKVGQGRLCAMHYTSMCNTVCKCVMLYTQIPR